MDKHGHGRPADLPTCKHGRIDFQNCSLCHAERIEISKLVKPLEDDYWDSRGNHDIAFQLGRAYRMGMEHKETVD